MLKYLAGWYPVVANLGGYPGDATRPILQQLVLSYEINHQAKAWKQCCDLLAAAATAHNILSWHALAVIAIHTARCGR